MSRADRIAALNSGTGVVNPLTVGAGAGIARGPPSLAAPSEAAPTGVLPSSLPYPIPAMPTLGAHLGRAAVMRPEDEDAPAGAGAAPRWQDIRNQAAGTEAPAAADHVAGTRASSVVASDPASPAPASMPGPGAPMVAAGNPTNPVVLPHTSSFLPAPYGWPHVSMPGSWAGAYMGGMAGMGAPLGFVPASAAVGQAQARVQAEYAFQQQQVQHQQAYARWYETYGAAGAGAGAGGVQEDGAIPTPAALGNMPRGLSHNTTSMHADMSQSDFSVRDEMEGHGIGAGMGGGGGMDGLAGWSIPGLAGLAGASAGEGGRSFQDVRLLATVIRGQLETACSSNPALRDTEQMRRALAQLDALLVQEAAVAVNPAAGHNAGVPHGGAQAGRQSQDGGDSWGEGEPLAPTPAASEQGVEIQGGAE